jgi:hypothetical protein
MTAARRTRAKAREKAAVVARGTPAALTVALEAGGLEAGGPEQSVAATFAGAEVVRLRLRRPKGPEPASVRMRFASTTPPGTYRGEIRVGELTIPTTAEVQPRAQLRADPSRLALTGAAGADLSANVLLTNAGNVTVRLPERSRVGLLAAGAWGDAFWFALTEPNGEGARRFERFVEGLADRAAGLAEIRLGAARTLDPGASERLELSIRLPDRLEAGTTYHGTWEPEGLRLALRVTGQAAAAKAPRSRRRGGIR